MRLSVCLIVNNEENVLDRCLSSASCIADELIVVDTGSEDRTKEIAKKYTPFVYDYIWHDSFCDARNFSYEKSSGDYLMWLDADDVIEGENINRIIQLKQELFQGADVVYTIYRNYSKTGITEYRMRDRIICRNCQPVWQSDVHEAIYIDPSWNCIYRDDITILHKKESVHDANRNMRIFERNILENRDFSNREKINLCREYANVGKYEDIIRLYKSMQLSLSGKDIINAIHAAEIAYVRMELYAELFDVITEAEKKMPPVSQEKFVKGVCREALGDLNGAAGFYREALTIPDNPNTLAIIQTGYNDYYPLLRLAGIAYKERNITDALRYLDAAGKNYPREIGWQIIKKKLLLLIESGDPYP